MEITRIKLDCAIQRRNKTFRNSRRNVWPKPFGEIDVVRTPLNDAYFARLENHVLDLTGKFDESALCCNVFDGDDYSDWVGDWRENYDKLSRLSNSLKHRRAHIDTSSDGIEGTALDFITSKQAKHLGEPSRVVFVGNPPYQSEGDAGGKSGAMPIYHKFVERGLAAGGDVVFVIPARWYSGGRGLAAFREMMVSSGQLAQIVDFQNSRDIFPSVDISGGVCFIHAVSGRNGTCRFSVQGGSECEVDLSKYDAVVRSPIAYRILDKVTGMHPANEFMNGTVSSVRAFGQTLRTNFVGFIPQSTLGAVKCRARGGVKWVHQGAIDDKGDCINKWKIISSRADGAANDVDADGRKRVLTIVEMLPPGEVCTETYMVLGATDQPQSAENWVSYLKGKFARFMLGLRKITQDVTREKFTWVPVMDFAEVWSDEKLYQHFHLSEDEIAYIEATIR